MTDTIRPQSGRLQRAGAIAEQLLRRRGMLTQAREASIPAIWEDAVGEYLAQNTEALYCSGGVLVVTTKEDASLAHALTHLREAVRTKLNRLLGASIVEDIHFQPREPGKPLKGTPPLRRKSLEFPGHEISSSDLDQVELSPDELQAIEAVVEPIQNTAVAQSVRAALTKEKRLAKWKQAHGYRACVQCGTLHKDQGETCLACRVVRKARHPRDRFEGHTEPLE